MTRLDDIQARHAKATPGPWERDPWEADAEGAVLWNIPANDWEFIAACPDDVRWLLDRVTQLETALKNTEKVLGKSQDRGEQLETLNFNALGCIDAYSKALERIQGVCESEPDAVNVATLVEAIAAAALDTDQPVTPEPRNDSA